jgi:HTH-type transcriptional regulator/antitoxin HigA
MTLTFDNAAYGQLLNEVQPKVITTDAEYDRLLLAVEALMFCQDPTPEQTALLELLATLVENYESEHYPMPNASPHEVLAHLMEARKLKQIDLVGILGSKGVVSEVVNGKRGISKAQAKALGKFFHVSPELFI